MAGQGSFGRRVAPGVSRTTLLLGMAMAASGCPARTSSRTASAPVVVPIAAAPIASTGAVEESPPPPKPRSPWAYANVDPDDDYVVGPPDLRPTCEQELAAAGVKFAPAKLPVVVQPKSKITCGAPQVVMYQGTSQKIAWQPSVMITCTMALALARLEAILQEEAQATFKKKVVRVHHVGTYACREMAAYPGWVSEHSYANAIDLVDFVLEDGRTIDVLKHFAPKSAAATSPSGAFLRAVSQRAFREEVFSSVLGPFFDARHANHFHLDMARFRSDGTEPLEAAAAP